MEKSVCVKNKQCHDSGLNKRRSFLNKKKIKQAFDKLTPEYNEAEQLLVKNSFIARTTLIDSLGRS